jgi:hypothetical protein
MDTWEGGWKRVERNELRKAEGWETDGGDGVVGDRCDMCRCEYSKP